MSWTDTIVGRRKGHRQSEKRLVFFGDSICVGQGVSIHKGWVTRIAARLSEMSETNGVDVLVVNASVNGETTRQALERMPYAVQSHGVDILLVQFGMNDCNYWLTDRGLPRVSEKGFAANIEEIVVRAFNFGAETVFVNTNHPTACNTETLPNTSITYEESNRRYNEIIRTVVRSLGERVILNDVEGSFRAKIGTDDGKLAQYLLADGLHLNAAGHDLYYRLIAPVIERVVKAPLEIDSAR